MDPVGRVYEIWHNGAGPSDSDHQWIYAAGRLEASEASTAHLLAVWLRRLHEGYRTDLNGPLG